MDKTEEFAKLIQAAQGGDQKAAGMLFDAVYPELRQMARRHLRGSAENRMRATSLVHEAFLRLAPQHHRSINDRQHFFALAARAMRQIIIDFARRNDAEKRGGDIAIEGSDSLEETQQPTSAEQLLALDGALEELLKLDERLGRMVELWFYGGMTLEEIADLFGVSSRTLRRDWRRARAFLYREVVGNEIAEQDQP